MRFAAFHTSQLWPHRDAAGFRDGEATCWTILGGIGSVEELRINAKSGVLTTPDTIGGFVDGVGTVGADEWTAISRSKSAASGTTGVLARSAAICERRVSGR